MEMWKDASQNEQYSVTARRFGQTKTVVYMCRCVCQSLSHVATLCDLMTPLSMEFSRQEYWSGQPFPSPVDLPDPGIKPGSPALQADTLMSEPPGKPNNALNNSIHYNPIHIDPQNNENNLYTISTFQHVYQIATILFYTNPLHCFQSFGSPLL